MAHQSGTDGTAGTRAPRRFVRHARGVVVGEARSAFHGFVQVCRWRRTGRRAAQEAGSTLLQHGRLHPDRHVVRVPVDGHSEAAPDRRRQLSDMPSARHQVVHVIVTSPSPLRPLKDTFLLLYA